MSSASASGLASASASVSASVSASASGSYEEIESRYGMEDEMVEILKKLEGCTNLFGDDFDEIVKDRREYLERFDYMEYAVMASRYFAEEARRAGIDVRNLPNSMKYDLRNIRRKIERIEYKVETGIEIDEYVDMFEEIDESFTEMMQRHGIYSCFTVRSSRMTTVIMLWWFMKDRTKEEHKMLKQMIQIMI